jgi:hypothetical protein
MSELPVFSFKQYRKGMWFHWVTGGSVGMAIGFVEVRLLPHFVAWFVGLQFA